MNAERASLPWNKLKTKRILVTGASGFIGYNLAEKLCEVGAEVFGTSRRLKATNKEKFTWLQCSFSELDETKKVLEEVRPDIIYHLSGEQITSCSALSLSISLPSGPQKHTPKSLKSL
jgi:UDP-glucose 4-epimerase